jgi:hypothetical protein
VKPPSSPRYSRRRWIGLGAGGLLLGTIADALLIEPRWLKTHRVPRFVADPGHRLVHFTDLHHKGDRPWLEHLVRRVNGLAPDFVCFTGDLVEEAAHLPEALEVLRGLRAPLYGVPGNHDYWAGVDFDRVRDAFAATGGRWLMDEEVLVRDGRVRIVGATCTRSPDVRSRPGLKNLLLVHYPFWVDRLGGAAFDLVLAGHSHGGQVRLPFLGAVAVPGGVGAYDLGLFRTPAGPLYVGSGVGWFYANVRFDCRPEVAVLEI